MRVLLPSGRTVSRRRRGRTALLGLWLAARGAARAAPPCPPPWPPGAALAPGERLVVEVEVVLGPDGAVVGASVVEPVGGGFDEAALQAAWNLRFPPGSAPLQRVAVPFEAGAAAADRVVGRVRAAGTGEALDGARVVAEGPGGARCIALVSADGRFRFAGLAAGRWRLRAEGPGLDPDEVELDVPVEGVAEAELRPRLARPWERGLGGGEALVVEGRIVRPEVTERIVDPDELRSWPGSAGDPLRSLALMPGAVRLPFDAGGVAMRGLGPARCGVFLDGLELPTAFHFGGLSTAVAADFLDEVAWVVGPAGVRYGRRLGGLVDLRTGARPPERTRGSASVDLLQAALFHEQRLAGGGAVALSLRRSYLDAVLGALLPDEPGLAVQLPAWWDAQARLLAPAGGGMLEVLALRSRDRFEIVETDSDERTALELGFDRFQLRWLRPSAGWTAEVAAAVGPEERALTVRSEEAAVLHRLDHALRVEFSRDPEDGGAAGWRLGLDALLRREAERLHVGNLAFLGVSDQSAEGEGRSFSPALYAEPALRRGPILAVAGVRAEPLWWTDGFLWALDVRGGASVELGSFTEVGASVGRSSQPPALADLLPELGGEPGLGFEHALQAAASLRHRPSDALTLEIAPWWARLDDLVVGREDRFEIALPSAGPVDAGPLANDGEGTAAGVDLVAEWRDPRTHARAALGLSRSFRTDRPGEAPHPAEASRPVQLALVATRLLGRGWTVGARFRYGSGAPYTAVANRVLDLDTMEWTPVWGPEEGARLPAWWSLDLRAERRFDFRTWALFATLDLVNATGRRNVEGVVWPEDWSRETEVLGMPVLPAFGVRGEWSP